MGFNSTKVERIAQAEAAVARVWIAEEANATELRQRRESAAFGLPEPKGPFSYAYHPMDGATDQMVCNALEKGLYGRVTRKELQAAENRLRGLLAPEISAYVAMRKAENARFMIK